MLAAAAVSHFVDEVVMIDKDAALSGSGSEKNLREEFSASSAKLVERAKMRKGVPQYIQPHGLLCRAAHSVELLLPGWQQLAKDLGRMESSPGRWKTWYRGAWTHHPVDNTGLFTLMGSRALIEESIRARLTALRPNVHIHGGCWAAAPLWSTDGSCLEGVVTKAGQEYRADLVIDAAGRRSPVPGWLEGGGYAPPPEVEVDPHVTYSSRLYRLPPQHKLSKDWDVIYIRPTAPITRGGLLQKIENGAVLGCVWGYSGDHPPQDEQGFLDFIASLEVKDMYEAVKDAEPLTKPVAYSGMTNLRRLYEDIPMPGRLAVVYGQGICVAAVEAETMQKLLQEKAGDLGKVTAADLGSLASQYQALAKHIVDFPFSATTGERPKKGPMEKLMGSYLEDLMKLSIRDLAVFKSVQEVLQLMTTPDSLVRPELIAKVLRMHVMRQLSAQP
ncbi:hypothetical protein COCSUDRAFT_61305 [Coccomyxa subellipsoidea C-169]|uniref:FAD/NAD(P)-binding domain-containing protein n=1 Tax=Coccomyxa subellipsoidea (strain C-169) TaxID=574566 RepID=I0Z342_COCSC|nr:hypothetical protein COCSUDRAFT_61305 [Coccomyxa subellipsoidea C-169]EIE25061.1 hypothetical protein COCSUDRAFT_61305 [Coccomyxa subellipsoidea C-169]|eukprot:XP_005649605.1 hypothetical protein COCSUDRAFT_61305 [Coccomyxa subellipsoidea C-169]